MGQKPTPRVNIPIEPRSPRIDERITVATYRAQYVMNIGINAMGIPVAVPASYHQMTFFGGLKLQLRRITGLLEIRFCLVTYYTAATSNGVCSVVSSLTVP